MRSSIPVEDVGATDDLAERFRRVNRWAKEHGYAGGFPTFNDETHPGKLTYGAVMIKPASGKEVWVPVTAEDDATDMPPPAAHQ